MVLPWGSGFASAALRLCHPARTVTPAARIGTAICFNLLYCLIVRSPLLLFRRIIAVGIRLVTRYNVCVPYSRVRGDESLMRALMRAFISIFRVVGAVALFLGCAREAGAQSQKPAFHFVARAEKGGIHKPFVDAAKIWLAQEAARDH